MNPIQKLCFYKNILNVNTSHKCFNKMRMHENTYHYNLEFFKCNFFDNKICQILFEVKYLKCN
jgi:hypothetical protein